MSRRKTRYEHWYTNEYGASMPVYTEYETFKEVLQAFDRLTVRLIRKYFTCIHCGRHFGYRGRQVCLDPGSKINHEKGITSQTPWVFSCSDCCSCMCDNIVNQYGLVIKELHQTAEDFYVDLVQEELECQE